MSIGNKIIQAAAGNVAGEDTDANFAETVLLINGDGAADGGQNNTFLDTSGNGHAITRNGNVTQGSFSPFAKDDGKWGNYFDGSGDYLDIGTNAISASGEFSAEAFVYNSSSQSDDRATIFSQYTGGVSGRWLLWIDNGTLEWIESGDDSIRDNTAFPQDSWVHVLLTRDASNVVRLFVDGELRDYGTNTASLDTSNFEIGNDSGVTNDSFAGYISNVRVVDGSIPSDYQTSSTTVGEQVFSPSTEPLTAISGTSLLTCQSNRFVDNSSNAHSITVNGDPEVVPFSPFPETTAYTRSTINQGAMEFDGSGDRLVLSADTDFDFGSGDFTIEAWFNATTISAGGTEHIIGYGTNSTNFWALRFRNSDNSGLQFRWFEGTEQVAISQGSDFLTTNQWFHVAVTRSGNSWRMFLDGIQVGSTVTNSGTISSFTGSLQIGDLLSLSEDFAGYISNVRLVKGTAVYTADFTVPTEPLTAITNTSLLTCQAAGAVDNSSNAHTITVNGDAKQSVFVPFGERSVDFDGTGDYLQVAGSSDFNLTGDFTVEFWIYNRRAAQTYEGFFGIQPSNGQAGLRIANQSPGTTFRLVSGSGTHSTDISGDALEVDTWSHIAMTRSGTTVKAFINGIEQGSNTDSGWVGTDLPVLIAAARNTASGAINQYNADFSNVRIVKGTAVYTADFTPPTAPLTAVTGTSLLTCQNSVFQDNSGNAHAITASGDPQASNNLPFGERSVYFDGSGDTLSTSVGTDFNVGSGDFTIESFAQLTATGVFNNVFSAGTDSSDGYRLDINTSNQLRLLAYIGGSWSAVITGSTALTTGQWYHLAVTRSGNDFDLWIDGVSDATTVTNSGTIGDPTSKIEIGGVTTNSLNRSFNGYLSNTRLVKGTAVYTADFTVPTEPLTAITGTSLLACQDAVFQDNSGNAHAITVNGNAEASTNIPFVPKTTYGIQQYLDDAYTVANRGGSGYFNGVDTDFLSGTMTSDLALGTEDCTIEAWIYCTGSSSTNDRIFDTRQGGASYGTDGATFQKVGSNIQFWAGSYSAGSAVISGSLGADVVNSWAHCRLSRISGTNYLYVNGSQVATNTNSWNQAFVSGRSFNIGKLVAFSSTFFDGYISDFRIIKGEGLSGDIPTAPLNPVSGTSLLCNFTNASIIDRTGSNVLETVGNAQIDTTTYKYGDGALYFDGTGDYLVAPSISAYELPGDFTVEFWLRPINANGYANTFTIGDSNTASGIEVYYSPSQGGWTVFSNNTHNFVSGSSFTGSFKHFALVRSSGVITLYIDGTASSSTWTTSQTFSGDLYVGAEHYNSTVYPTAEAVIDDFRITKGVARYTANFTPPTKSLPVIGA